MSESTPTPPGSRRKKLLIAAVGAAAACVLTAGAVVGVNAGKNKTAQLCSEAATSSREAAKAVTTSVEKATAALTQADSTEGYAQHDDDGAGLGKAVDTARTDLANMDLTGDCDNRNTAESIQGKSAAAGKQVARLDDATLQLADDVTAFQTEAKRIADGKAAEAAAKAAEEAKAAETAAAEQVAAEQAAAEQAAPAQPQYTGGGTTYAPAPQLPSSNYAPAPAPAPYAPAPAPAWTPPPMGSGPGGGPVCLGIGDAVFCTGD